MFATGLLMLACSDDWALDLANVSDIKGLTKGSVLDKLNKSLGTPWQPLAPATTFRPHDASHHRN